NKAKKVSYQAGLRAEITDVTTILEETNERNPRNYTNLFPSVHFTYNITPAHALQVSYSRRVRRPVYRDLSPYVTFSDQRNFFSGNPDLEPEFTNAFDLGYIHYFDKGSVSSSVYYRHTIDKILGIRTVDEQGFSSLRPENLATEDAYGLEVITSVSPYKWWKSDWNINFFKAITDGSNLDEEFRADTYSWFTRLTSRFNVVSGSDLQIRLNYEAPQELPQGRSKSRTFADLSFSKDLWGEKGTLTLNIMDLFNTRFSRTIIEGATFYTVGEFGRKARQINLTWVYRLNQTKTNKKGLLEG
ncbi:MAG: TonB-dependent receptor family protein, partial [Saprospiraceae bacterium]|nr:TonB-dependent receptor family protein [Saprospiraceae bacterium]